MRRHIKRIIALPKALGAKQQIKRMADEQVIVSGVPYQCQFATPALTADILSGKLDAKDDPSWSVFGLDSRQESAYWAHRMCGICCVKMALEHSNIKRSVADLIHEALELNAYNKQKDSGWYYKPLATLLNRYGLQSQVKSYLTKEMVVADIKKGNVVIASVNPQIIRKDEKITSRQKSGHLVLVVGYTLSKGVITSFFVHNPSGSSPKMRRYAEIDVVTFSDAFGERGIIIKPKESNNEK